MSASAKDTTSNNTDTQALSKTARTSWNTAERTRSQGHRAWLAGSGSDTMPAIRPRTPRRAHGGHKYRTKARVGLSNAVAYGENAETRRHVGKEGALRHAFFTG